MVGWRLLEFPIADDNSHAAWTVCFISCLNNKVSFNCILLTMRFCQNTPPSHLAPTCIQQTSNTCQKNWAAVLQLLLSSLFSSVFHCHCHLLGILGIILIVVIVIADLSPLSTCVNIVNNTSTLHHASFSYGSFSIPFLSWHTYLCRYICNLATFLFVTYGVCVRLLNHAHTSLTVIHRIYPSFSMLM